MTIVPTPIPRLRFASVSAIVPTPIRPQRSGEFPTFAQRYPQFVVELAGLRSYRDRELAKLSAMRGKPRRDRTRKLLRCGKFATLYAYEGIRRAGLLRHTTVEAIRSLATRCNPFDTVVDEHVHILEVPNGVTSRRTVVDFGPKRRMHQLLVADILRSLHPPRADQYLYRGGMPMALRAIEAAYAEGFEYGAEVDMVGFYGSIGLDGLAELLRPLPAAVCRHVVWDEFIPIRASAVPRHGGVPALNGLTGLFLGAATSPIVGERIIASLLAAVGPGREVTYADNLFVLGRSREEVEARMEHLGRVAASLDVGPLRPSLSSARHLSESFEFLKQDGRKTDDGFIWQPGIQKIEQYLVAHEDEPPTGEQITLAEKKLIHWRRAYPGWPDGDAVAAEQLATLAALRFYRDGNLVNLNAAANALFVGFVARNGQVLPQEMLPTANNARDARRRQQLVDEVERRFDTIYSFAVSPPPRPRINPRPRQRVVAETPPPTATR